MKKEKIIQLVTLVVLEEQAYNQKKLTMPTKNQQLVFTNCGAIILCLN